MVKYRLMSRRRFLYLALASSASGALAALFGLDARRLAAQAPAYEFFNVVKDPANPTALEKEHIVDVRLPLIAEDGANVPIVVSLPDHPMTADDYIKSIQIVNFKDPIVSKGIYHFTPANGLAYLSTQIRMDGGDPTVYVIAECSKHGKWVTSKQLKVSLGGC